jgi:hypothetical protein
MQIHPGACAEAVQTILVYARSGGHCDVEFILTYTMHSLLVMSIYPVPAYISFTRVLCTVYNRTYTLFTAGLSNGDRLPQNEKILRFLYYFHLLHIL